MKLVSLGESLPGPLSVLWGFYWVLPSWRLPSFKASPTVSDCWTCADQIGEKWHPGGLLISISLILSKVEHLCSKDICVFSPRSIHPFLNISIFNPWQGNDDLLVHCGQIQPKGLKLQSLLYTS